MELVSSEWGQGGWKEERTNSYEHMGVLEVVYYHFT